MDLRAKSITTLKSGDFSGLTGLADLNLYGNQLSSLPDAIFEGLTALTTLRLGGNTVAPMPIPISLEKVGEGQFKATASTGAPFDIVLPIRAMNGSITDGVTTLTISKGSTESGTLTVTRTPDTTTAVTADIGTLPGLPLNHYGYVLSKSEVLPLEVVSPLNAAPVFTDGDTTTRTIAENTGSGVNIGTAISATDANNDTLTYSLSGTNADAFNIEPATGQLKISAVLDFETKSSYSVTITVSDGSLTDTITATIRVSDANDAPVFIDGTSTLRTVSENTGSGVNIGSAVSATDADSDTLMYSLNGLDATAFRIDSTTGQLKTQAALDYETKHIYTVTVTASDSSLTDTITVVINVINVDDTPFVSPLIPVSDRTPEVSAAIVAAIPDVNTADGVSIAHLAAITSLNLRSAGISALKSGDFSGMTGLTDLNLYNNLLSELPVGIFEGLTALTTLRLGGNFVDPMLLIVSLQQVGDGEFQAVIPTGAPFDIVLPINVSNGRMNSSTTTVTIPKGSIVSASFTSLSPSVVIGALPRVPLNHYGYILAKSAVCNRTPAVADAIAAAVPGVEDCWDVTEVDLATITTLNLQGMSITVLQSEDFSGMYSLTTLNLSNNELTSLPDELFEDLASLTELSLSGNNLSSLPGGLFDSLSSLATLNLSNNELTSLPDGIFNGLDSLGSLSLSGNSVSPLPLTVSLEKVDDGAFSVVAPAGAPFDIVLPILVANGSVDGDVTRIMIHAGNVESEGLTVTRTPDTIAAVTVDIAMLPSLPSLHNGYTLVKSNQTALEVIPRINSAPVFTDGDTTTRIVAENTETGEAIGSPVSATDIDPDTTLVYSLGGTDAAAFSLDNNSGQLQTLAALDYETKNTYSVTVTVSDGFLTDTISVTVNIADVDENRAPVFTDGTSTTRAIAENTVAGTNIGAAVSATDEDGDTLTYSLGGTDVAAFELDETTGQLKTRAALDYETKNTYSVTVTVSDGFLTDTISVTVNVADVDENRAPVFTDGTSATRAIVENTVAGTNIGAAVSATDEDGDTLTYSLGGTDVAAFELDETTGQLKTRAALDYETKNTYSVTVTVSDGFLTDTISVTVNVADVDENRAPVFTDGTSTTRAIVENTVAGTSIGAAVSATDADSDTLTYSLSGPNATSFGIDISTGQLKTSAALDYETKNAYSVTITASDGKLTASITVTIKVTDVDEVPSADTSIVTTDVDEDPPAETSIVTQDTDTSNNAPVFTEGSSTTRSIAENTGSGVNIGSPVSATDADGHTLLYSLGGTDAAAFSLDTTSGQLRTQAALDYEIKNTFALTITVTDGSLTASINVTVNVTDVDEGPSTVNVTDIDEDTSTVNVTDVDEDTSTDTSIVTKDIGTSNNAPVFTEGSSTTRSIAENTGSGVDIGSPVSATDADGHTLLYSLGGTDAAAFSIDSSSGQLRTSTALDYEYKSSYAVSVSVSDGNGGSNSITVTITVTDVAESRAPVFAEDSTTRSVAEGSAIGTNIGAVVSATDPDGNSLTYSLSGTDAASFSIVNSTGQLRTNVLLDYETKSSYSVTVTASDGTLSDSISVTISVIRISTQVVNNAPVFTEGSTATRSVDKGTYPSQNLGAPVSATDADDDTLEYSLGGTDAALFEIDSTNGQLSSVTFLHYEDKSSYSVTIAVSDSKGGTNTITVTITDDKSPVMEILTFIRQNEPNWVLELDSGTGVVRAVIPADDRPHSRNSDSVSFTRPPGVQFDNSFIVAIVFDEEVSGLDQTDLTFTENTAGASVTSWEALMGWTDNNTVTQYRATVEVTQSGNVTFSVAAGAATDGSGNSNADAGSKTVTVTMTLTEYPPWDVNEDGSVDATDSDLVTAAFGQTGEAIVNSRTDVNWDDTVDSSDLTLVTYHINDGGAPSIIGMFSLMDQKTLKKLDPETLQTQLDILRAESDGSLRYLRAITLLENVLAAMRPNKTLLLANYPNPFNPETWIPYHLANASNVVVTIYDTRGAIVRQLDLGHKAAGYYTNRSRAVHWDGRNNIGERVTSGIYFYQLQADNLSRIRKMVILK